MVNLGVNGHHFLSHTITQLLNEFNNCIHKVTPLNNLTAILAILIEHYSQNDNPRDVGNSQL